MTPLPPYKGHSSASLWNLTWPEILFILFILFYILFILFLVSTPFFSAGATSNYEKNWKARVLLSLSWLDIWNNWSSELEHDYTSARKKNKITWYYKKKHVCIFCEEKKTWFLGNNLELEHTAMPSPFPQDEGEVIHRLRQASALQLQADSLPFFILHEQHM